MCYNKYFIILSGFIAQWYPSEEKLNEILSANGIVSPANLDNVVCGHIDNTTIYFYNGNKKVNSRVIELADKWHTILAEDKKLNYGFNKKKVS